MNENESQSMGMPAKPVDTSMQRIEIEHNGQKLWMDWNEFIKQKEWMKKLEEEYWARVNPLFRKHDRQKD
jgi:endonuclease III